MIAWSFGFFLMAVVVLQEAVPAETLLLDRVVVSGGRWYSGMITSLGILAWTVSAVACLSAAFVAKLGRRRGAQTVFSTAALWIGVLLLDDLFLLHSNVVPRFLGVPKLTMVALEAIAVVVWLAASRREVARTRWELLAASGAAFALSNVMDVFAVLDDDRWRLIIEDGSKFFGVLALAAWSVTTAADIAKSVVDRAAQVATVPVAAGPSSLPPRVSPSTRRQKPLVGATSNAAVGDDR